MDKPLLVVIGNGMAGVRLVERLCELAPTRYRIVVIGDEAQPAYNRIMLTPVLAGEKRLADITTHDSAWYERYNVTLIAGSPVTAIDREARTLSVNGQKLGYDRLVIATGSLPLCRRCRGRICRVSMVFAISKTLRAFCMRLDRGNRRW